MNNSLQYSSEGIESDVAKENIVPSPTQKAFLRQRRKSFSIDVEPVKISSLRPVMVTGDDIMRQVLLRTYDADVIDLWMNRYDLDRIAMHAKMQNTTSLALLKTLVDMSSDLKNNKNKIMDDLYASEKIRLTSGYDKKSEAIFIIACDADKNKIKQRLWIEQMYLFKNDIHKNVEIHKTGVSLLAWPLIKEIQIVQKLAIPGKK